VTIALTHGAGAGPVSAPPRLARAEYLSFGAEGRTVLRDQVVRDAIFGYLADMLRPHGVPFDEACFLAGNQNSYAFLAGQCLTAMREEAEPDLIVLAHATADCESSRSLSGYLTTLFRGEPLCFAISDQGELSPFTALHVLRGFGTSGTSRRALVLVLDQSTLPYVRVPDPGAGGTDHVLGLLFVTGPGPAGRPLAAVWHRPQVTPDKLGQALAEVAAALPAADPQASEVTVVAGEHIAAADLAPLLRAVRLRAGVHWLHRTPPGPACVAPWAAVAGLPDSTTGRVLVIGYDRSLAALSVALFDPVTPGSAA
jgi:hypothetical protein